MPTEPAPTLHDDIANEITHPRPSVRAALAALGLAAGMHVVDVGCSGGAHLGLFADAVAPGGTVTGLDRDAERIALAATMHAGRVADGTLCLQTGDMHALPFDAQTFDVVWSSLVLHHDERPRDTLAEWARVLRTGGMVAVLDGDGGGSFPIVPWSPALELKLRAAALRLDEERYTAQLGYHFAGYVGRQLPRLLRETGLVNVQMHALADVDRAPLCPQREAFQRNWFVHSFGQRLRPYLAPRDWEEFAALFDPDSTTYLLNHPDFFMSRTWYLGIGRSPTG